MTGIPDELVEKAARTLAAKPDGYDDLPEWLHEKWRKMARAALEAVGLPALLERVEAAERHVAQLIARDWWELLGAQEYILSLDALLNIPEGEEGRYSNPDGAYESIIYDWVKGRMAERDAIAAKVADAGERIALAIEAASEDESYSQHSGQGAFNVAARIARAALTEEKSYAEQVVEAGMVEVEHDGEIGLALTEGTESP